jgi:ribosomal protein S14
MNARLKNSCVFTDRSKFVLRRFKISRVKLRRVISLGEICGVSKYSW